jgi:hypothetical protein
MVYGSIHTGIVVNTNIATKNSHAISINPKITSEKFEFIFPPA